MHTPQRFRIHHLLVLAAPLLVAPVFPGLSTSSAALSSDFGEVVGPDGLEVVERQVSSDMVVDWLEAPPPEAADWFAGPEAPADHRATSDSGAGEPDGHEDHVHEDHGQLEGTVSYADAAATSGTSGAGTPGKGFAVYSSSSRWLPSGYTVRLAGDDARIEQYRDEFAAAIRSASSAAGLPVRLAAGRGGSVNPSRGEITVVLGQGPCGSTAIGCGGPALTSAEIVAGRVWISPAALGMSPANRSNLAAHELGHALGLQHYSSTWNDGRQVMHPTLAGTSTFRSGDGAGLRFMSGGYDRPAGTVTARTYAAGQMRVSGTLSSGSRVRVAVGSTSKDVTASAGRFSAEIPAGAGSHRVCAVSLDAASGFRRNLGCSQVTAHGLPGGRIEVVANSFTTIRVSGWALDPQTASPVDVEIRRNGTLVRTASAGGARPDVAAAYEHYGPKHGYDLEIPAVAGVNDVCVRVLGVGGGGNRDLGCRKVDHAVDPIGAFDVITSADLGATVSGWALDPNTPAPVNVTVSVNKLVPAVPGIFRADAKRGDVARAHPAHGPNHGFSQRLVLAPGAHEVCLTASNVGLGKNRSLGCARVQVDELTQTVGSHSATARLDEAAPPIVRGPVTAVTSQVPVLHVR